MVASPTGPLRRLIGTTRRNLATRVRTARTAMYASIPEDREDQLNLRDELRAARGALAKSVDLLQSQDREFLTIVGNIADDEDRQVEEDHYDKTALEEHGGYLPELETADTLLDQLDARIERLDRIPQAMVQPPQVVNVNASGMPASTSTASPANTSSNTPSHFSVVKPPKLTLPKFDGHVESWSQFWTIFQANIHDRPGLTNTEKMTYLLAQIYGKAKEAIDGLPVSDTGYEIAISILKERFDKAKERMGSTLVSQFRQIPTCGNKVDDKRRTYDACEKVFRQMEEHGIDLTSNVVLNVDYLGKFPLGMAQYLQRQLNIGVNSTLPELREAIKKMVSDAESLAAVCEDIVGAKGQSAQNKPPHNKPHYPRKPQTWYGQKPESGEGINSTFATFSNPPRNCYFCSGPHWSGDCRTYDTVAKRRNRLTEVKRCNRCTQRHHESVGRDQHCQRELRCFHCKAQNDHHSALCPQRAKHSVGQSSGYRQSPNPNGSRPQNSKGSSGAKPNGNLAALNHTQNRGTFFQTAKVTAVNLETGQETTLRIALDTMSNRTFITNAAAKELNLKTADDDKLYLSVFGANKQIAIPTSLVEFGIREQNGNLRKIEANTTSLITNSNVLPESISEEETRLLQPFHNSGNLADDPWDRNRGVDVLIGSAYSWEFIAGPKLKLAERLFLIPTTVGMMLAGESGCSEPAEDESRTFLCLTENSGVPTIPDELGLIAKPIKAHTDYPDIDTFWKLEAIGITDSPTVDEDELAVEKYKKSVYKKDGRYQVTWPWIEELKPLLPSNEETSLNRFRSLCHRLKNDSKLFAAYRDTMRTQTELGIIERVPDAEISTTHTVHYLPHHPIVKESSATTKVRVVFDASSKSKKHEKALNECLLRGPVLLPDLCHLLMRFRLQKIAIVSDIEKAFLQVSLQTSERDVTRFFWLKNDENPDPRDNLAVYRFCRVLFGVISSPFLLMITLLTHLESTGTQLSLRLAEELFVDNVLSGADSDQEAVEYYPQVKQIFKDAGMNLREFCSNSTALMQSIPAEDRVTSTEVKVLGIKWDSDKDELRIRECQDILVSKTKNTKRTILAALASVFDPLGLFQPSLLPMKLLLQNLWELKLPWDEDIKDEALLSEWNSIREDVALIFRHRLPRFISQVSDQYELLVFSDASGKAYGAAVYLRHASNSGYATNLLFAKSRLAPSSKKPKQAHRITLPRLELMGATIAARIAEFCRKGVRQKCKIYFFIDSECVLYWIRSQSPLKRFVANRVDEIRAVENCEFRYVHTDENPADLISRGKPAAELLTSQMWWHGPSWSRLPETEWPQKGPEKISDDELRTAEAEIKTPNVIQTFAVHADLAQGLFGVNAKDCSSLRKLVRRSCANLKLAKWLIWSKLPDDTRKPHVVLENLFAKVSSTVEIDVDEMETALKAWVKHAQEQSFPDLLEALANDKPHTLIKQLGVDIDADGLLRTYSRFQRADLPPETQSPLLLSNDHPLSLLVVHDAHRKVLHSGVSHTLAEVRTTFWIIKGRALVRKALHSCVVCQRLKTAAPFARPPMPDWPIERTKRFFPFQNTGLDYFGPIQVKQGQTKTKMWVCLCTCMSTRAVHLEPVTDCTTTEFLQCLIRFISRRGCPEQIVSDNAAQFGLVKILADKAWQVLQDKMVSTFVASRKIRWKFITQLAPWQGGFYERMVGIVKSVLRKSIGRRLLSWTELVTLLTEVEAVVNSRPLTYLTDDVDSLPRILRPVDFLSQLPVMIPNINEAATANQFSDAGKRLLKLWKEKSKQLDEVWKIWYEDYLLNMRETGKRFHKRGRSDKVREPRIGQVVLLKDDDVPRGRWKLCRIAKLLRGNDGQIRSVELQMPNRLPNLRRPVNHVLPLELDSEIERHTEKGDTPPPQPTEVDRSRSQDVRNDRQDNTEDDQAERHETQDEQEDGIPWDADFLGFSEDDIARTTRMLQRFADQDDAPDDEIAGGNSASTAAGSQSA